MDFDDIQKAWKEQRAPGHVKIESDALLKLMRRNHESMERLFFGNYFLVSVFGLVYVPLWIWLGVTGDLPWTWYLHIPAFLWVAGFMLWDRIAHRRRAPQPGDPIRGSVEQSLVQIDHEIRLQKNVFWWYLLPPAVPMAIFFLHCGLESGNIWGTAHNIIVGGLIFWFAYELIQRGVRKNLEPRRDELLGFLESLDRSESKTED